MATIEVSAGLVFHHGKLLITQRPARGHLGGLWEFPGGKREPGEAFEACLIRELQEELGIEVSVGALVDTIEHEYPEKRVHLRFFRCRLIRHEPRAIGCAAFAWVNAQELDQFAFPAADAQLLARLKQQEEWWRED